MNLFKYVKTKSKVGTIKALTSFTQKTISNPHCENQSFDLPNASNTYNHISGAYNAHLIKAPKSTNLRKDSVMKDTSNSKVEIASTQNTKSRTTRS